jgi:site-specific DNA-methyltransferase (adenine-specific)
MKTLPDGCVDAVVTDPPYGLEFMGKDWDRGIPGIHFWREALRVAKPGCHLLVFGGTRTHHRLMCAIEDAGWEIRDCVMWVYGSGFPKSLDVSKAIDKAAGPVREVVGRRTFADGTHGRRTGGNFNGVPSDSIERTHITAPATDAAKQWDGWGTALKPAWEPIILARKPLDGTVAANVLKWGTGAINVDGCRVGFASDGDESEAKTKNQHADFGSGPMTNRVFGKYSRDRDNYSPPGRWPANLIHDGSEEVLAGFPANAEGKDGFRHSATSIYGSTVTAREYNGNSKSSFGSAARFFYCAKASRREREAGLEGMAEVEPGPAGIYPKSPTCPKCGTHALKSGPGRELACDCNEGATYEEAERGHKGKVRNNHPTVKPIALMRYLCKLVTQPGGTVLDPFAGSGSTGIACIEEGFNFLGIEIDPGYFEIAKKRIEEAQLQIRMPLPEEAR